MLTATVSIGGVLRRLEDMRRVDRRKIFGQTRRPARGDQRDHSKQQEGPSGRWAALASSTVERRAQSAKRRRRRRLLGRLPAALVMKHDADRLTIRPRPRWGHVHQLGGRAGWGARITARPYLWISRNLLRGVKRMFVDAYRRAWTEGR